MNLILNSKNLFIVLTFSIITIVTMYMCAFHLQCNFSNFNTVINLSYPSHTLHCDY